MEEVLSVISETDDTTLYQKVKAGVSDLAAESKPRGLPAVVIAPHAALPKDPLGSFNGGVLLRLNTSARISRLISHFLLRHRSTAGSHKRNRNAKR